MSEIAFSSHGYQLAGNYFPAEPQADTAFLMLHGWRGTQNLATAEALAAQGFTTMTYDMRGHNASEGDIEAASRAEFISDAVVAYDDLRQRIGEGALIGAIGNSFGSYTAVRLTAERGVHCLSLRAPANYPDTGHNEPHAPQNTDAIRKWREQPLDHTQNETLGVLHRFGGEIHIVEAGLDEIVASQTPVNYANAAADPHQLTYNYIADSPHRLLTPELHQAYTNSVISWATGIQPS